MPIYHVLVISRSGGLIYDWGDGVRPMELEKTFSYPMDIRLQTADNRTTVTFGERDGVKVGHCVIAVNGVPVSQDGRINVESVDPASGEATSSTVDVISFLHNETNFPVSVRFARPTLSTNEKLIMSSTFHALYSFSTQLSPVAKSSGIHCLDTEQFRLHCFQSVTGIKFIVIADIQSGNLDPLLRKIYELYADFALKNPFYSLDMPIRNSCELFDIAVKSLLEKFERTGVVTL